MNSNRKFKKMKILFVCKHNRFRSKIAEAYFNKINKNKKITASSAGVFKGYPVDVNVINIGKKYGLKINRKTNGLNEKNVREMNIVVIVANDVPASIFDGKVKKIISWKISDSAQSNKNKIEEIMKLIIEKVDDLVRGLR